MKILMLAPQPFFSPRGTPFSEYHRINSLCRQGHEVDLITYPIGQNIHIDGLTIHRCPNPLGIKSVKTGPSLAKIYLDILLFFSALRRFLGRRYDLIHTHEEAAFFAYLLRKFKKVPHLYDMHSSLVQQMDNFQTTRSSLVLRFFHWFERKVLNDAAAVIVICRSLFDHAAQICSPGKLVMIENFIDDTSGLTAESPVPALPEEIPGQKIVFYAGTLEAYQGIPLLLEALPLLPAGLLLWLAGGQPAQIEALKETANALGVADRVHFFGQLPPEQIPPLIEKCDVLVSPRSRGTNIPLKVYSYLKSGKPLVATDIYSHTQTLTPDISILVKPEARDLARGITQALTAEGDRIAAQAALFCRENYTLERYDQLVKSALDQARSLP
jgi:glycosyltransferase involved in cell wall biosynthesis